MADDADFSDYLVVQKWEQLREKTALENKTDFLRENKKNVIEDFNETLRERVMLNKEMKENLIEKARLKRR